MKKYNARCPICDELNTNLYLVKSGGMMICRKCNREVHFPRFMKRVPVYSTDQLIAMYHDLRAD